MWRLQYSVCRLTAEDVLLRFNITRETLVEALEATFTATPLFAPLFIPLALDKLASSVRHGTCRPHGRRQTVMSPGTL